MIYENKIAALKYRFWLFSKVHMQINSKAPVKLGC